MTLRDHGGNLAAARARFGEGAWLDLSTGINRRPWPMPPLPDETFRALPDAGAFAACEGAARAAWGAPEGASVLPVAGAQAAIQLIPRLRLHGRAAVLAPTYNEHAAAFRAEGWQVVETPSLAGLEGADAAVVVNPNNPDGRRHEPEALLALAGRVGLLVVDESFGDVTPELSLVPWAGRENLLILRSFGKFHGLAGLRLGFALGAEAEVARMAALAGPWAVSGPALAAGAAALADRAWAGEMRAQLARDAARLDAMVSARGLELMGGTDLFRTYRAADAGAAQAALAQGRVWTRAFPWSRSWIRLGLPGPEAEWAQLEAALGRL